MTAETAEPPAFVPVAPIWWATNFGGLLASGVVAVRSKHRTTRALFAVAVGLHVVEAAYAYRAARARGLGDAAARRWGLQTLGVGFPSLVALRALTREREAARP
jgi:hypothetical protein